jgi:Tfp pilus assembly protein PilV
VADVCADGLSKNLRMPATIAHTSLIRLRCAERLASRLTRYSGNREELETERRGSTRRLAQECGFTLIELLVASVAAFVVLTAVFALLVTSQRVQARDTEWALTLQQGRAGLARMVREIRQAYSISAATGSSIDFFATIGGKELEISYQCNLAQPGTSLYECVRLSATPPAPLPALSTGAPLVRDVLNETAADSSDPVFSYSPTASSPTFATVKVTLPAAGTLKQAGSRGYAHRVVLSSGAFIRNVAGASG